MQKKRVIISYLVQYTLGFLPRSAKYYRYKTASKRSIKIKCGYFMQKLFFGVWSNSALVTIENSCFILQAKKFFLMASKMPSQFVVEKVALVPPPSLSERNTARMFPSAGVYEMKPF